MHAQRWRLTHSRAASVAGMAPREQAAAWDATLAALGDDAPTVAVAGPSERPKLVPAAPLPVGMSADRELTDLLLPTRWTMPALRSRLDASLPGGHRLVDLWDVWAGAPSLPSQLVAGDYLVTLDGASTELSDLVASLLAAPSVARHRQKGESIVTDDQRPLILDVRVVAPDCLWMRLRFDPVLGTGRPEDVVRALGELGGTELQPTRRHRERVWLRDELDV